MDAKKQIQIRFDNIDISNIEESPLNANEQDEATFRRLVKNIKKDGTLTSAILIMEQPNKRYMCISGHHRVRAALKSGLSNIPCLIIPEIPESDRIRLQLSHNDIKGTNNEIVLSEMTRLLNKDDFEFIDDSGIELIQEDQTIKYEAQEYSYINLCLLPSSKSEFLQMIEDLKDNKDNILITIDEYDELKNLLTLAFKNGFKSNGSAMRKFIDIVNSHKEEIL